MYRGQGDKAVTEYNCDVVRRAVEDGVNILVADEKPGGKVKITPQKPRVLFRADLTGEYGDQHDRAGEGKYIATDAWIDKDHTKLRGAHLVNPFLPGKGNYRTIIQVLQRAIGVTKLRDLVGEIRFTKAMSDHIHWVGKRSADDCLVACRWLSGKEMFEIACDVNDELNAILRKRKSPKRHVVQHLGTLPKFVQNVQVMQRATRVLHISTGEISLSGGASPCAFPLQQAGFAIDSRYMTYAVEVVKGEIVQHCGLFFRLVVGRTVPHVLTKREHGHEGADSDFAFLNEKVRADYKRAIKAVKSK
jgi:hypothetical protein